ncbi:MAG: LysM peptidoglycan-binding domain-containing protein [Clostridia bacterium]|nr:LysM peptidoglycan-binding domain-containing protein [Clostridia bacterium]
MENFTKVSATVVSRSGVDCSRNKDNFYLDGRSMFSHEAGTIQVSIERGDKSHIFAVCEGMVEEESSISVIKELNKFYSDLKSDNTYFEYKTSQLAENIQLTNNLIYSKYLNKGTDDNKETSFAGLVLSNDKLEVLNIGSSSVYLLREGKLKCITPHGRRVERLVKLGIITEEQVKGPSKQIDENSTVHIYEPMELREGDIFLVCNGGLTAALEEDRIGALLGLGYDASYTSNMLIKAAVEKGVEGNITALVVKVEQVNSGQYNDSPADIESRKPMRRNTNSELGNKSKENIMTYIAAAITCVIIAGLIFAAYIIVWDSKDEVLTVSSEATTQQEASAVQDTEKTAAAEEQSAEQEKEQEQANEQNDVQNEEQNQENNAGEQQQTDKPAVNTDSQTESDSAVSNGEQPVEQEGSKAGKVTKYEVQSGDSLEKISKKFYNDTTKYKTIMDYNNIKDPNSITVGQVLSIPMDN